MRQFIGEVLKISGEVQVIPGHLPYLHPKSGLDMETVESVATRCKSYKLVQMLESKSVRETVGQHWKD